MGRSVADDLYVEDRDAREAGATLESIIPNLRYRWRDRDAREVGATPERPLLYLRFPLRYDDLAILDVVAVFLVFCHDSSYFRFGGRFRGGVWIV